jgi:hypothetical protein
MLDTECSLPDSLEKPAIYGIAKVKNSWAVYGKIQRAWRHTWTAVNGSTALKWWTVTDFCTEKIHSERLEKLMKNRFPKAMLQIGTEKAFISVGEDVQKFV